MDFTDDASDAGPGESDAPPTGDTFPEPESVDAEALTQFNEQWVQRNPNAGVQARGGGQTDATMDMPFTAKGVDRDDTRFKSEFPWLYEPAKGARWDFDPIELRTLSQENAWVGMMVATIAKEIAETSWTITEADDARETDKRLSTHPEERDAIQKNLPDSTAEEIYDSLRSPNPDHDWTDLIEMWVADYLEVGSLTGTKAFDSNAYADDDSLRYDAADLQPHALQASAPEVWTKDYHDKSGLLNGFWQFARRTQPGGTETRSRGTSEPEHFGTGEVMWSDHSPKSNRRYGTPPTLLVGQTLQSLDLAQTQEQQYLSRGSIPSGAWVFEEWDREQVKEWKQENAENLKGKPHKSLMFAGQGGGVTFEPMSMNFSELEFTDRMRWYARIVAAAFQVPTAVVGVEPEKVNYNTFQGERANFESNTLGPYLQQIERVLNDQFVEKHWDGYRFEFTPGLSESTRGMITDRVTTGFNSNILTRNEARRELGYEKVDEDGFKDEVVEETDPTESDGGMGELLASVSESGGTIELQHGTVEHYKHLAKEFDADVFQVVGQPAEGEPDGQLLAVGVDFPNSGVYVDWNIDVWPEDERLDGPHVSEYDTMEDVITVTGGEVEPLGSIRGDTTEKADASDAPLRNTEDYTEFDVQPSDVDALYTDIADDVQALFEDVLSDDQIQQAIERLAAEQEGDTTKSAGDILRRIKEHLTENDTVQRIREAVQQHTTDEIGETLGSVASEVDADVDTDPIRDALQERDVAFADGFANRMSDEIRETVADGWEADKNSLEIRDDLQEKAEEFGDWQAERIARQEMHVAAGEARQQFAAEAGKVEVWETSGDDRVRDAHADMAGTWKWPEDDWVVEYDRRGTQKESVQGDSEPGIGCRCTTLLVDRDEVDASDYGGADGP